MKYAILTVLCLVTTGPALAQQRIPPPEQPRPRDQPRPGRPPATVPQLSPEEEERARKEAEAAVRSFGACCGSTILFVVFAVVGGGLLLILGVAGIVFLVIRLSK